jgi:hypothetical protein
MRRIAKITALYVERGYSGLYVRGILSIPKRTQFDDVTEMFDRRYSTKSLIVALWRYRRDAEKHGKMLQKEKGRYTLQPTNKRKGLMFT